MDQAISLIKMYFENIETFEKYNLSLEDIVEMTKVVKEELCKK